MAKAYVVGASIPTAGAFMAYHLGRILQLHFGYEAVDVEVFPPAASIFHYDVIFPKIPLSDLASSISDDDILVANPSFSNQMFGLRLKGRKVMYVQDFKTFTILDCHFDLYVSVSGLVQRFLQAVYGFSPPVINSFIQLRRMPEVKPWRERPPGSVLVYVKHNNPEHRTVFDLFRNEFARLAPDLPFAHVMEQRKLSHAEFLATIGSVRYAVILSIAEGLGLVPLEAMALGAAVTGLDGIAGVDYMRYGENSMCLPFSRVRELPEVLLRLVENEDLAERLAEEGKKTAQSHGYPQFRQAWLEQFARWLGREPENV